MMKKLVALLMALALLCSSIGVFAEEHVHVWEDIGWVDDKEPTCTKGATKIQQCVAEGCPLGTSNTQNVPVDALGHDTEGVDWTVTKEATALENGLKVKYCKTCTEVVDEEIIPPTSFKADNPEAYDFSAVIKLPTDKEENLSGIHTKGFKKIGSEKAPTCTAKGEVVYYCIDCGKDVTIYTPATGHTPLKGANIGEQSEQITAPTCTTEGVAKYTGCAVCDAGKKLGDKLTVWEGPIPKEGHKYADQPTKTEDATCTEPKKETYVCSREGCGHVEVKEIGDPLGHSWERDQTKEENQEKHDHVIVPPTCTEKGKIGQAIVCNFCDAIKKDSLKDVDYIDAVDHQYYLDECEKNNVFYTIVKDEDDEDKIVDVVVSTRVKELAAKGENVPAIEIEVPLDQPTLGGETTYVICQVGALKIEYVPATCTETGKIALTCVDCKAHIEQVIPALGHDWKFGPDTEYDEDEDEWIIEDCTKPGYVYYHCTRCPEKKQAEIEAKPAHAFVDEDGEIIGYIVGYAQEKGGDGKLVEYGRNEFNQIALCHTYYAIVRCRVCQQETLVEQKPTEEHSKPDDQGVTNYIKQAPTCTEVGYEWWNCAKCGWEQKKVLPATKHVFLNGETIDEPTCTEEGVRAIYCSKCGKFDQETGKVVRSVAETTEILTEKIPALGHHYVTTVIPGTCETKGSITKYCTLCKDKIVTDTGYGHVPNKDKEILTVPATCTEPGKTTYWCALCHDHIENEVIPATGHSYEVDADGNKLTADEIKAAHANCTADCDPATCKTGAAHGTIHNIKCTNPKCKEVFTWEEDDKPTDHSRYNKDGKLNNFVYVKYPSCEETGLARYTCAVCGDIIENYELPAIPHNLEPVFDEEKGQYVLECVELEKNVEADVNTFKALVHSVYGDEPQIEAAIVAKLLSTQSKTISSFGTCGYTKDIEVTKTTYDVTRLSETRGQIKLQDPETMAPLFRAWVRVVWRYTLSNKDTISFVTTREITWDNDAMDDDEYIGTFKLTGLSVPEDAHCDFIRVEVVTDPDADEKYPGEYTTYGKATW